MLCWSRASVPLLKSEVEPEGLRYVYSNIILDALCIVTLAVVLIAVTITQQSEETKILMFTSFWIRLPISKLRTDSDLGA